MQPYIDEIIARVTARHPVLAEDKNWGERALFFNPERRLPKGVYVLTFKERDGPNDSASHLDRGGLFRLNIGLTRPDYLQLFGPPPLRPAAGQTVDTGHDFTLPDTVMPHPVYAWMSWIAVISPSDETLCALMPRIDAAVEQAETKFSQRVRRSA
jgi:hypothetical protein